MQIIFILIIVILTTLGWGPSQKYHKDLTSQELASLPRLKEVVSTLALDIGVRSYRYYENLEKSADYINDTFKDIGLTVTEQAYELEGMIFKNIIAEYPNANPNSPVIIIGAHYDTCFNPGADDNASGIAGLFELARHFNDKTLNYNLKFIAFVNEEPPFFSSKKMGSYVYAADAHKRGENIKAAVILEMIGYFSEKPFSQKYLPFLGAFYPNKGNFIALIGNFRSHKIVHYMKKGFRGDKHFAAEGVIAPSFIPGVNFSDHLNFWRFGKPAVMVTDTAFLRTPHYHDSSDLPETLDYHKMAKVITGLKAAIVKLDEEL